MLAKPHTFSLLGIEAVPVDVEVPFRLLRSGRQVVAVRTPTTAKGTLSTLMSAVR